MSRPIDMPSAEHWPHGTRARYVCSCRCGECRRANTEYSRARARRAKQIAEERAPKRAPVDGRCPGVGSTKCGRKLYRSSVGGRCEQCREHLAADGLVSTAPARRHLEKLSALGVGYKSVANACDVSKSTLLEIITGQRRHVRKSTLARILAVDADAIADAGYVDAAPTWVMLNSLVALGYRKVEIARRLGFKARGLQFGKTRILARTALSVRRLHDAVMREHEEKARVVRERCTCQRPMLLEREAGLFCARCDRAVIVEAA